MLGYLLEIETGNINSIEGTPFIGIEVEFSNQCA